MPIPYPKNAKIHPDAQLNEIAKSLKEFGWRQPILVDKNDVIIVGHGRWSAYSKYPEGIKEPWIVKADDLSDEQVRAYRLADNKLNESEWKMDLVIEELKELPDSMVDLTGFSADLLIEQNIKDDEVPEIPEEPKAKLGDIFQLGKHRIMCGDSTKLEDVEKLMNRQKADCVVTDPPYNTGMKGRGNTFDYDWSKKKEKARPSHMFNDEIEDWPQFLKNVFANYYASTKGECAFYVFIDWRKVADIKAAMEEIMDVKNVIVWDKHVHGLGSDYKFTYELCVVGKKGKPEIKNRFGLDYQDIWRVKREMGRNEMHATVKPIELLEKPIKHASKEDDIILDLFLGAGSTLIAAEKTNRICYGMELEPKYIDVIIKRWEDYTGLIATKI